MQKLSADSNIPVPVIAEKLFRIDGIVVTVEVMAVRCVDNGTPAVRVVFREIASSGGRGNVSNKKSDSV
jgi:hypothetical protein